METMFLATVVGWYMVIISLFMLFRHEQVKEIMSEVIGHRGLFFVVAILTLIIGLIMVVSHNIWVMGWPVIITIFSWLVLISGLIRLVCADTARNMANSFITHSTRMRITAIVLLLLGLFILAHIYFPRFVG